MKPDNFGFCIRTFGNHIESCTRGDTKRKPRRITAPKQTDINQSRITAGLQLIHDNKIVFERFRQQKRLKSIRQHFENFLRRSKLQYQPRWYFEHDKKGNVRARPHRLYFPACRTEHIRFCGEFCNNENNAIESSMLQILRYYSYFEIDV